MPVRSEHSREILGSRVRVVIVHKPDRKDAAVAALHAAFDECERIERSFSRFLPQSELGLLNGRVGEWVAVSNELFLLLSFCEEMRRQTGGAFDATVLSILEGWGYDAGYSLREGSPGSTGSIGFSGEDQVRISVPVDLGGVGKGYAMDRMLLFLRDFNDLLIDAGGDLYARGKDEQGKPWRVAFEHPTDLSLAIGETTVDGFFLASSSPARRKWRDRHHLVDPAQSAPAGQMLITYVRAQRGMLADAWSTALFVMGYEKAIRHLKAASVNAMIIGADGAIARSPGFGGQFYP